MVSVILLALFAWIAAGVSDLKERTARVEERLVTIQEDVRMLKERVGR